MLCSSSLSAARRARRMFVRFLRNVLRGRRISTERLEEVVGHYEHFGGVSPLTDITMRQARGLEERLSARGFDFPSMSGCAIGIRSSPTR